MLRAFYDAFFAVYSCARNMSRRLHKITAERPYLKSEQVVAEQPRYQFRVPGAPSQRLVSGPGDVPELPDRQQWIFFFQIPGEQGEMIVLHQHQCFPLPCFLEDGFAENPVYSLIRMP